MKIGYFFKDTFHENIDARDIDQGNPGIGGREFMNLSMAYYLSKVDGKRYQPVVFSQHGRNLPKSLSDSYIVEDVFGAFKKAKELGVWLFVTDVTLSLDRMKRVIDTVESLDLDIVVRLGLFPSSAVLHLLNKSKNVLAVVAVEHNVLDMFRDHPVARKTIVMPNAISFVPYQKQPVPLVERGKTVSYLGSLVPQKGFGVLARAWPKVIKSVPDARLNVIGSGHTYGGIEEFGIWGLAEKNFEDTQIRPFLSDDQGNIHPSVSFLGSMGQEKAKVLRNTRVGVANPTGDTETFCISAVEIQAASTPVVAGAKYGLFDTVCNNKTGFLIRGHEELADRIIQLLTDDVLAEKMGQAAYEYVFERYNFYFVIKKWIELFDKFESGQAVTTTEPKGKPVNLKTSLIRLNSCITHIPVIGKLWPTVVGLNNFYDKVRKSNLKLRSQKV